MAMLAAYMSTQCQPTPFDISGTTSDGAKIVYYYINHNSDEQDSVNVSQGRFHIRGKAETNVFITVATDLEHSIAIVNDGMPVKVDLNNFTVIGSPQNEQLGIYQKSQIETSKKMPEFIVHWNQETDEAKKKELQDQFKTIEKRLNEESKAYIREYKDQQTPAMCCIITVMSFPSKSLRNSLIPRPSTITTPWPTGPVT